MTSYFVEWSIDIDADSPREAAEKALEIQRDPSSSATVFSVIKYDSDGSKSLIDLDDDEDEGWEEA
jgi:hypothetical protein